jgi:hypothetical protein
MGNLVLRLSALVCLFACPHRRLLCIWFQWAFVGLGVADAIVARLRVVAIHPLQTQYKPSLRRREVLYLQNYGRALRRCSIFCQPISQDRGYGRSGDKEHSITIIITLLAGIPHSIIPNRDSLAQLPIYFSQP